MADRTDGNDEQGEPSPFVDGVPSGEPEDRTSAEELAAELERLPDDAAMPDPDDLPALRDDDALLDMLGGQDAEAAGERDRADEHELNELLLSWRRDIDSAPMAELVDTDTALATISSATASQRRAGRDRRRRALVPVAVAAAVLAIAFTGTGLAARNAEPGDPLWGLTKVLYTDHAQSVQAAASVRLDLATAERAIEHGRYQKARQALQSAQQALSQVQPEQNLRELRAEHHKLSEKLEQKPTEAGGDEQRSTSTSATSSAKSTESSSPSQSGTSTSESSTSPQPSETATPSSQPTTSSQTPSSSTTSAPTSTTQSTAPTTTSAKDAKSGIDTTSGSTGQSSPLPPAE